MAWGNGIATYRVKKVLAGAIERADEGGWVAGVCGVGSEGFDPYIEVARGEDPEALLATLKALLPTAEVERTEHVERCYTPQQPIFHREHPNLIIGYAQRTFLGTRTVLDEVKLHLTYIANKHTGALCAVSEANPKWKCARE
jgi:hypothetical protein